MGCFYFERVIFGLEVNWVGDVGVIFFVDNFGWFGFSDVEFEVGIFFLVVK